MNFISSFVGKILEDAKTISEYKIEESKFVVAMVAKVTSIALILFNHILCYYIINRSSAKPKAPLASPVASPSEETTATSSSPTPKPSTEEAEKPKADSETPSSGAKLRKRE